jgi:hypothetical protein
VEAAKACACPSTLIALAGKRLAGQATRFDPIVRIALGILQTTALQRESRYALFVATAFTFHQVLCTLRTFISGETPASRQTLRAHPQRADHRACLDRGRHQSLRAARLPSPEQEEILPVPPQKGPMPPRRRRSSGHDERESCPMSATEPCSRRLKMRS